MIYKKNQYVGGAWVKGQDVVSGTNCRLVSETEAQPSQFKDKNGNVKMQDVSKIRFEGGTDSLNISLNRATINALVDAFGEDSKLWINKELIASTEKVMVAGKRVTVVYLLPKGYEIKEDDNGYIIIVNPNKQVSPAEEIQVDSIPF